ncbi:MAG TPA: FlgD immunoglobulin-like domain containing protein, partial [Mycobacterium sp.]|nr:FlgD immunoglobulin-like domain containing protein [Mycobacterium sp.]
ASDANFTIFAGSIQAEAGPQGTCISTAHPCLPVIVTLHRPDMQPVRAFDATLQLSANLTVCGAQFSDGTFLQGVAGGTVGPLQVFNNGGGSWTVDQSLLGSTPFPCGTSDGATATDGTLFVLWVTNTGADGVGTISVTGTQLRKCDNSPEPVGAGGPLSITIDNTPPGPITALTPTQQKLGNDVDGTTKIKLTFTAPGDAASVEVWRAGFGSYPEYDDAGGSVPATPGSYPPGPPWVLTSVSASGQSDETTARDFYYFVAYAKDACGNVSAVSTKTNGTLNYHLGDWHNGLITGDCQGNNLVNTSDLSFLGAHYGITLSHSSDPYSCLDVGPTTDTSVNGRPTTDDKVQFEDLVLFAINYFSVSLEHAAPEAAGVDQVRLSVPSLPAIGEQFSVGVDMSGTGDIQALSVLLTYDHTMIQQVGVAEGELLQRQASHGVALSAEPGDVDVALLGTGNGGIAGTGRVAQVTFRVVASGDPRLGVKQISARDANNHEVALGVTDIEQLPPGKTALGRSFPNPFQNTTSIQLSLAKPGMMKLGIYDVQGRLVRSLMNGYQTAGQKFVIWNGSSDAGVRLAAGVYVIRMEAQGVVMTRRVALVP